MNNPFQSVLFLSTGRTGTKFLASTLGEIIPEADVFHEGGERSRLINIISHAYLAGIVPLSFPSSAWKIAISDQLKRTQETKSYYIDCNNHLYILAQIRPELYPGLKVIHIVRDPRTYIRSHLNWSRGRLKSWIANYLTPFWQPTGYMVGEMSYQGWLRLSKLEKFAWVWNYKNKFIQQFEGSSTPYLRIKFEDLFEVPNPESGFKKILDFIGVASPDHINIFFRNSINASQKQSIPGWMEWPSEICNSIASLCKQGMNTYGYGSEQDWIRKVSGIGK